MQTRFSVITGFFLGYMQIAERAIRRALAVDPTNDVASGILSSAYGKSKC